ncbi:MAG: hypothetical protein M3321_01810 [Actinomycetota bacterium]|nr:hypothetical protein [Actinomycetota bacterium]
MKRCSLLAAATVAALAFGAPASAKELTRVAICGQAGGCGVIQEPKRLRLVPMGGETSVAVPPRQPYYVLTYTIEHGGESEELGVLYLPESNLLAANGVAPGEMVWLPIGNPRSAELLRDVVAGIEPYPATRVWPWPHGLKSTYRVIPDDAIPASVPSASQPRAARGPDADELAFAPVVAVAAAIPIGLAALVLLLRRLTAHQPRDELA